MAARGMPEEVAAHLHAAIQLSNRRVYFRLLDEAETLITLKQPSAGIIMAVTVLDSFLADVSVKLVLENERRIAEWRDLRSHVVHRGSPRPSLAQATETIRGARRLLTETSRSLEDTQSDQVRDHKMREVRGKYRFVPTTSTGFIERKADELRLEHQ